MVTDPVDPASITADKLDEPFRGAPANVEHVLMTVDALATKQDGVRVEGVHTPRIALAGANIYETSPEGTSQCNAPLQAADSIAPYQGEDKVETLEVSASCVLQEAAGLKVDTDNEDATTVQDSIPAHRAGKDCLPLQPITGSHSNGSRQV